MRTVLLKGYHNQVAGVGVKFAHVAIHILPFRQGNKVFGKRSRFQLVFADEVFAIGRTVIEHLILRIHCGRRLFPAPCRVLACHIHGNGCFCHQIFRVYFHKLLGVRRTGGAPCATVYCHPHLFVHFKNGASRIVHVNGGNKAVGGGVNHIHSFALCAHKEFAVGFHHLAGFALTGAFNRRAAHLGSGGIIHIDATAGAHIHLRTAQRIASACVATAIKGADAVL